MLCNCKRSKCLQKYCECFAAGRICSDCNCTDCKNTEKDVGTQVHNAALATKRRNEQDRRLGCNCEKSRCLRKYCVCFATGVPCNGSCKCKDCENPLGCTKDISSTATPKRTMMVVPTPDRPTKQRRTGVGVRSTKDDVSSFITEEAWYYIINEVAHPQTQRLELV